MNKPQSAIDHVGAAIHARIEIARKTAARVLAFDGARRAPEAQAAEAPKEEAEAPKEAAEAPKEAAEAPKETDEEAVHDFRVALRRLRTALKPARKLYGQKRMRAIDKRLKRYADATSALRDEEVLHETLEGLELADDARAALRAWLEQRSSVEQARRAEVIALLRGDSSPRANSSTTLNRYLRRLESRLERPKLRLISAQDLGLRSLERAHEKIRAVGEPDPEDSNAMHALRIRYKRLRYTAELFADVLGEEAERIAKKAARLQSRLGDLHDIDVAIATIDQAQKRGSAHLADVMAALRAARPRLVERCVKELAESKPEDKPEPESKPEPDTTAGS